MAVSASSTGSPEHSEMAGLNPVEFNAEVVEEFRARGGYVTGPLADFRLILVHHIGARSGVERVMPLIYFTRSDGGLMIIASNGGSCTHPAWYYNLKAHPKVTVELGTERFRVVAEELDSEARSLVWPTIVEQSPAAGDFQRTITRSIPVFVLTRED
jgi:deazaflavin-dependent oxidoreductase (nitroreductase family)